MMEYRQNLVRFYDRFENLLVPAAKFLAVLLSMSLISRRIGSGSPLAGGLFIIIVALFGALVPGTVSAGLIALVIVGQCYDISLASAGMAFALFLLFALLYLRFSPKDAWLFILAPVFFTLRIPYVLPVAGGLLFTPFAVMSVTFGTVYWYFISFLHEHGEELKSGGENEVLEQVRALTDALVKNRALIVFAAVFALTLVLVYIIRRLAINNAWTVATAAGCAAELVLTPVLNAVLHGGISYIGIIPGIAAAFLAGMALRFLFWNLDYRSAESVQFEDDDYYYYVKAVPKIGVTYDDYEAEPSAANKEKRSRKTGKNRRAENIPEPEYDETEEYWDDILGEDLDYGNGE